MKSISFFLQPKQDVTYLLENSTMRQAMEKDGVSRLYSCSDYR